MSASSPRSEMERRLKQLAVALKADPGSIPRRLELAAALRDGSMKTEAIELYRGVAGAYAEEGRLVQAMAVCKGILDIDPSHRDTLEMLATLAQRRVPRRSEADSGAWPVEATAVDPSFEFDSSPVTDRAIPLALALDVRPTDPDLRFDAPLEGRRMAADDEPAPPPGRLDDVGPGLYEDDEAGATLIQDAIDAPFPRSQLRVDPPPFPLLSDLPRAAFMELLAKLTVVRLEGGQNILREGEVGDACYLIASGSVRVIKGGLELAVLGPGSFFGEFAVLADQRRHASVESVDAVELLEIRRALLDDLVQTHPGVARTLRRFYRERLLQTLLATAPFFAGLSREERLVISDRFRPRRFGRGARIIDEGAPGGGLFLVLVGQVQIVHGAAAAERELGRLGEGSYFGEMSLLRGATASATVRATRTTEVVQLPPRDFYDVVSQHPVLWEKLRSEAERRTLANHAILSGEARKSDDGTIYLV